LSKTNFEWDENKNKENIKKHKVTFSDAVQAFYDENRIIAKDLDHSTDDEVRYYCFGKVGPGIMTVRFTLREKNIRIFGAGYWRKGKKIYGE
jgi:uncharacterized DUF497 family protein